MYPRRMNKIKQINNKKHTLVHQESKKSTSMSIKIQQKLFSCSRVSAYWDHCHTSIVHSNVAFVECEMWHTRNRHVGLPTWTEAAEA